MRLDQPLNDIFASGTHVKLLRALCTLPAGVTVSARDLARRAGVSHPRASTVLTRLAQDGVATVQRLPRTDLYGLNRAHELAETVRKLFGTHLNVLVGSPTLDALIRSSRPGRNVWQAVEREGIDVL